MLHNPLLYLSYSFGVKALISAILTGAVCSLISPYIFLRKMAFAGAGLAHVALSGIAFGILIGSSPSVWAFIFTALASVAIWYLQTKENYHFDITMGIMFATSVALAVIFLSLSNSYGSSALSYLFGSPLGVEDKDIMALLAVLAATAAFYLFFWREVYLITFSYEIAKASGYKVELITFLMSLLISAVITVSIKAVGALLVFSLLVMPSASAFKLSKGYFHFFLLSLFFGLTASTLGILASFTLDAPPGATITIVSFLLFIAATFL
ncbi:metal ABC transporter permease [Thermovibrio sp.]